MYAVIKRCNELQVKLLGMIWPINWFKNLSNKQVNYKECNT